MFVVTNTEFSVTEATSAIALVLDDDSIRDFYDTRVHMVIGDDPEHPALVFPEPFHPEDLCNYAIGVPYSPAPGELGRTFWVTIQDMDGNDLSDPVPARFETGVTGVHYIALTWGQVVPPPVTPPIPVPPGEPEVLVAISDILKEIAAIEHRLGCLTEKVGEILAGP